jgi:hypothetical protein
MQIRKRKIRLCVAVCYLFSLTFFSCTKNVKRDFFRDMKESYSDLKIDSSSYFLKNFGIISTAREINGNFYWKMSCEKGSLFYISGFIRKIEDSIVLIPSDFNESLNFRQNKLFDFGAPVNSSWNLLFENNGNMLYGDSIVYVGSNKKYGDTVYRYVMHPFYFYKRKNDRSYFDYIFKIDISKNRGILSIITLDRNDGDTLFFTTIYPIEKIKDKRGGKLLL